MRFVALLVSFVPLLALAPLEAQQSSSDDGVVRTVRRLDARRLDGRPPVLDGRLDDAAWQNTPVATDFVQMRPQPGAPASARTDARILFDDDAVYVGMRLHDHPDSVAAQLTRRDASGDFTDWAHVLIDSYHDRRTAFRFSITPRGAKRDVLHFNDGQEDVNWDAVWEGAAAVDADGWTAEFRIPLSQLRFSQNGQPLVWGVNFGREIARRGEWAWWSPVLPTVGGIVSQAGELHELGQLRPPRRVELIPYTVGRLTAAPADADNPFYQRHARAATAGADLRLGIGSNLTLSATINPDFGQVEQDPSVVNLTAFETFYPEKRPFFTEGGNLFAFRIATDDGAGESLFYSRRIGRAPQRFVRPHDGWADVPDATTILGAAKLSGRTAGGWSIGLLNAVTAGEDALVARPGMAPWTEPVEPRTNYSVVSVQRDFRRGRSTVGFMGTAVHRDLSDDDDAFSFLRTAAWAGAVQGRHRFAADNWEISGYLGGSHIRGSEAAILRVQRAPGHYFQRPDADHVRVDPTRTSLSGMIGNFWVGPIGGTSPWRGGVGGHFRTPGYEVNDVGFQMEADQIQMFANLRYNQFQPRGIFRSFQVGLNPFSSFTFGGERLWTQIGSFANFDLKNFWNGGWWMARRFSALANGAMRGGPAVHRPGGFNYSFWLNSDRRRPVGLSLNTWGGREDDSGSWNTGVSPTLSIRPSSQFNLSVGPNVSRQHNSWQYVDQAVVDGTPRYILGELDQTTVSLTARMNYTISPTLSLELYAQPFISGGEFSAFRTLGDARAPDLEQRFPELRGNALAYDATTRRFSADTDGDGTLETGFQNPDFNFRQMRGNAVLRWEYMPGSTLFLVWGQSRTAALSGEPGDAFSMGRDTRRLFNVEEDYLTPVTNVFILKVSYWLNP